MSKFIRLNITAEGQAEESFVKQTLAPYLGDFNIIADVRCVLTSKNRYREHRGGMISYEKAKADIKTWIKEDNHSDARFTTMFDLYKLPTDFPDYTRAAKIGDPYKKILTLESALKEDIKDWRFIPYLQLHEFETLLFSKPKELEMEYFDRKTEINKLEKMVLEKEGNPELINDGDETSPSKRIIRLIPEYESNKVSVGAPVAGIIGIEHLRHSCKHFNDWILELQKSSFQ